MICIQPQMDLPDAAKPFGSYSERSLLPLAQAVAVCEMSVQHLRGAGKVCETTMQRLAALSQCVK